MLNLLLLTFNKNKKNEKEFGVEKKKQEIEKEFINLFKILIKRCI